MTKKEAKKAFEDMYRCEKCNHVCLNSDTVALAEEWNNYTDYLCKTGDITSKQYETWDNPY
jgi:hypothetical protein